MAKKHSGDTLSKFVDEHFDDGLNSTELAELYLKEHEDCTIPPQSLALMIYSAITNPKNLTEVTEEKTFDIQEEDSTPYKIVGENYVWNSKKCGAIKLSIKDADRLFYEYSKFGMNKTQDEMRRIHGYTPAMWNTIHNTLGLYKTANIISPYTEENTPDEDKPALYNKMFEDFRKHSQEVLEAEYQTKTLKAYTKEIKDEDRRRLTQENFLSNLATLLPDTKKYVVRVKQTNSLMPKEVLTVVADLHIGAQAEGLINTPNFNREILENRLDEVAAKTNATNANNVTLAILGDIIESFTGLNHPNSWQGIETGMFGSKVFMNAIDILGEFFSKIHNLKTVYIIGGNHDRITASNKEDVRSMVAGMISFALQKMYGDKIEIIYNPLVLTHDMDTLHFVFAHGDKKIINKNKTDQLIVEHGVSDKNKINMVMTGHLHSRDQYKDTRYLRWHSCPSVFSGNQYSEENGWNARPGFVTVQEDNNGCPIITDYTLAD